MEVFSWHEGLGKWIEIANVRSTLDVSACARCVSGPVLIIRWPGTGARIKSRALSRPLRQQQTELIRDNAPVTRVTRVDHIQRRHRTERKEC